MKGAGKITVVTIYLDFSFSVLINMLWDTKNKNSTKRGGGARISIFNYFLLIEFRAKGGRGGVFITKH